MNLANELTHGLTLCPRCGEKLLAPFSAAGHPARCKRCDHAFRVPSAQDLFDDAVAFLVNLADESAYAYDDFVSYDDLVQGDEPTDMEEEPVVHQVSRLPREQGCSVFDAA